MNTKAYFLGSILALSLGAAPALAQCNLGGTDPAGVMPKCGPRPAPRAIAEADASSSNLDGRGGIRQQQQASALRCNLGGGEGCVQRNHAPPPSDISLDGRGGIRQRA